MQWLMHHRPVPDTQKLSKIAKNTVFALHSKITLSITPTISYREIRTFPKFDVCPDSAKNTLLRSIDSLPGLWAHLLLMRQHPVACRKPNQRHPKIRAASRAARPPFGRMLALDRG